MMGGECDMHVTLSGWQLDNPIVATSGTFGYGQEFAALYDINRLGSFSFKGTTLHPRLGNPTPRIAEGVCGMLLSIGLQNPGVEHVIAHELPQLRGFFHKPVIANVAGATPEEYIAICERLDGEEQIGLFEINISCPNVETGMAIGSSAMAARSLTEQLKRVTRKPVYMKLSPNVTDIAAVAVACAEGGADGLSLINTLTGMRIDLSRRRPVLAKKIGGYAGAAVLPVALAAVYRVYEATHLPLIGMGGVRSAEDAIEMMLAGATAVGVGTANLIDPYASLHIVEQLPSVMAHYGIASLREIIGAAHAS